jgi:hypothetical protein
MSHDHMFAGCTGTCMQGRLPCDCRDELANGGTRSTEPGDLEPNLPDPAEGVSGLWIGLGLVGAITAVAACWHAVARVIGSAA